MVTAQMCLAVETEGDVGRVPGSLADHSLSHKWRQTAKLYCFNNKRQKKTFPMNCIRAWGGCQFCCVAMVIQKLCLA